MTNLQKRIITYAIILPLSIFFVIKGGWFLSFFLIFVLFAGLSEVYVSFKKTVSILFLSLILILSLFSIYHLSEKAEFLLYFAIAVTISSDVGGYIFGKIFKWKKLTKISPNKTISGSLGSFLFSLFPIIIYSAVFFFTNNEIFKFVTDYKIVMECLLISFICQLGDLFISYYKRLANVKDIGNILPGHGGLLDRLDGIIFAIPTLYIINHVI